MKCPYCGAEVRGRICDYCDSELWKEEVKVEAAPVQQTVYVEPEDSKLAKAYENVYSVWEIAEELCNKYPEHFTCYEFKPGYGLSYVAGKTKLNNKIFKSLGLAGATEDIFLIRDDSLFGNGKNGFAVTKSGFIVKALLEDVIVTGWDQVRDAGAIALTGSPTCYVSADEANIAYFCGEDKVKNQLLEAIKGMNYLYKRDGESALER